MAFVDWTDGYLVGVQQFDKQHKRLFEMINELFECVKGRNNEEQVAALFDELVGYTVDHFYAEEKLMKQRNYPGYEGHVKEHEEFKSVVVGYIEDYKSGNHDILLDILRFLSVWLSDHIGLVDKKYSVFLGEEKEVVGA